NHRPWLCPRCSQYTLHFVADAVQDKSHPPALHTDRKATPVGATALLGTHSDLYRTRENCHHKSKASPHRSPRNHPLTLVLQRDNWGVALVLDGRVLPRFHIHQSKGAIEAGPSHHHRRTTLRSPPLNLRCHCTKCPRKPRGLVLKRLAKTV